MDSRCRLRRLQLVGEAQLLDDCGDLTKAFGDLKWIKFRTITKSDVI